MFETIKSIACKYQGQDRTVTSIILANRRERLTSEPTNEGEPGN